MRHSLISCFLKTDYLDLHGSVRRENDVEADDPVFEIMTGVAIVVAARAPGSQRMVRLHDLTGTLDNKLLTLRKSSARRHSNASYFVPRAPNFAFRESDKIELKAEYEALPSLTAWLGTGNRQTDMEVRWATGFASQQDNLAMGFDPAEVNFKLEILANSVSFKELQKSFRVCTTNQWNYERARSFAAVTDNRKVDAVAYRPFDRRYTVLNRNIVTITRDRITSQMRSANIALLFSRAVTDSAWAHVFVASLPSDKIYLSNKTSTNSYVAPLWIRAEAAGAADQPNLARGTQRRLAEITSLRFNDSSDAPAQAYVAGSKIPPSAQAALPLRCERGDLTTTFSPRDVFDWIYAVLHSPEYRTRYADFLKSDFARVPLPKDRLLFAELVSLGTRLVALHLFDPDGAPELAEPKVKFSSRKGEARLGAWGDKKDVRRDPVSGRVYINADSWFATVPQQAWEHWIGGYQPAQKWLKDRAQTGSKTNLKPGRVLTDDDILHYRRMIVALTETAKLQAEIDKVIACHGGWPGAFKVMTD